MRDLPTIEEIRELLDYNPDTGDLIWRYRDPSMFKDASKANAWNKRFAGVVAGGEGVNGYRVVMIRPRLHKAHRLAWAHYYGSWPENMIDHIDGDRKNNSISNLRDVTNSANGKNARISRANKTGVTGVFWREDIQRWSAYITSNRKRTYLGHFVGFDDAVAARKAAEPQNGFHQNHGRA